MGITKDIKAELGRRVAFATEEAFLDERIRPFLNGHGHEKLDVRVVQLDSTGAATVEVRPDVGPAVFAKFFPPGTEGQAIFDKLGALRAAGLGDGSDYQVVEPLGYLPELDLLVCREAAGPSVADVLAGDDAEAGLDAVRRAATWLGRLHSLPVRIGQPHSMIVSTEILSLTRRLAKVAAERPEVVPTAVGMVEQLERLSYDTVDGLATQSHGQYRPIHVFLGDRVGPPDDRRSVTTVIDLDRSRPADPARDTAEFLHRLRRQLSGAGRGDAAVEGATNAFMEAYCDTVPDAEAWTANLRFHWARYVFHSMNRKLKKGSTPEDEEAVETYKADFAALVDGRLLAGWVR
ncbi:MAG: phosphotransferase family protein [Acidimicrobiia bacterium]